MDTDFHGKLSVSLWYDILCVLCFLLCMFLLYITVLLTVGVIKDDDFTNSWGVWGNFNILCLDSLPCPSILGEKGKLPRILLKM